MTVAAKERAIQAAADEGYTRQISDFELSSRWNHGPYSTECSSTTISAAASFLPDQVTLPITFKSYDFAGGTVPHSDELVQDSKRETIRRAELYRTEVRRISPWVMSGVPEVGQYHSFHIEADFECVGLE